MEFEQKLPTLKNSSLSLGNHNDIGTFIVEVEDEKENLPRESNSNSLPKESKD
jgi:hypothetical protein